MLVPLYRHVGNSRIGIDEFVGDVTIIDDVDAPLVARDVWRLHSAGYACARAGRVYMHRVLLGLPDGDTQQADHRNRLRLDNRRGNLRAVTKLENNRNLGPDPGAGTRLYSRFPGVTLSAGRWRATITLDGKKKHLGRFGSEEEAAKVAAAARAERGW